MALRFQPGNSAVVVRKVGGDIQEKVDGEEARTYSGQGAGGKLRPSRRSSRKATPYDRPASGRHATVGGPSTSHSAVKTSSFTSRLVGSASHFITSSASYFFPSLFGRRTLALLESNPGSVQEAVVEEQDKLEESEPFTNQETEYMNKNTSDPGQEQMLVIDGSKKPEKREFDFVRVEDMLKQKAWSREQVGRLTDLLNTRLIEHPSTDSRLGEAVSQQPSDAAVHAGDSTPRKDEGNIATPISEAQRWREELKRARTDCVPVEVARAYMGELTSLESSLTRSFRGTAHQMDRVAELQPAPGLGLAEDRYRSFPVLRSRTRSAAPQLLKKGPLLDEEWMSVGPVRRTRHKLFHMNSSPYARALPNVDPVVPQTYASPPMQSSQTARKILDTLEMLSPSPKSKHVNDEPTEVLTPDFFSIQGRQNMHATESFKFSSPSNGRLEFVGSPSNHQVSKVGTKKESYIEDKRFVNRLLSRDEAGFFSGTRSLLSSSVTTTAPLLSIQPESKSVFACTLRSLKPEVNSTPPGSCSAVPALAKLPELTSSPSRSLTPSNTLFSVEARLSSPFTDGLSVRSESLSKESIRVDSDQRPTSLQFGSPSLGSPFAFKLGTSDSQMAAKGLHSSFREDGAFGAQSGLSLPVSLPASPFMLTSTPAICSVTTTATSVPASASSALSSLFGSLQGFSPLFKASPTGELFGSSSITKPVTIAPLTLEASSAPFTFSPPPPLVSCSTPTFPFCSSAGVVNVSFEASAFKSEDLNSIPVFNFTSPSGGPKIPVSSVDVSLPAPSFTFGGGALESPSGGVGSVSTFGFGTLASFPSGTLVAPTTGSSGAQLEVTGSLPQQQGFKFGGQATSERLFPFSSVDNSQAPAGPEATASFASGAGGSEKSGRKFLKVKRRK